MIFFPTMYETGRLCEQAYSVTPYISLMTFQTIHFGSLYF